MTFLSEILVVIICVIVGQGKLSLSQSIGYGMPNFGLLYNPYTSPAWGYGMGPQYSSVRGAMAYGMLGGPAAFGGMPGMAGMGPMGGGLTGLSMLSGFGGSGMPYGPFAGYAQPGLLSGQYNFLGPYGRYPGSTGSLGYGSQQGYNVYNGYGMYSGIGGLGGMGLAGDYDHYGGGPWAMGSRDTMQGSQPVPGVRPAGLQQFGLVGPEGPNAMHFPPNFRGDASSPQMSQQIPPFRGDISRLPPSNHFEGDGHGRMGDIKDSDTSASSSHHRVAAS